MRGTPSCAILKYGRISDSCRSICARPPLVCINHVRVSSLKTTKSQKTLARSDARISVASETTVRVTAAEHARFVEANAEFFDLIYDLDPGAANDKYYVTSADFLSQRAQIRKELVKGSLFWAAGIGLAIGAAVLFF